MRLLLGVIVAVVALPLSAAFGPERPVTTAPLGSTHALQLNPSVSAGSEQFLVIWTDFRSGSGDAFAARLDVRGNVLDPTGILLGTNATASSAVAPGRDYLVALTDAGCGAVHVVTLDSVTGAVSPKRRIGDLNRVCAPVQLVGNGKTVLAIMGDSGALLDPTGAPVVESLDLPDNSVAGATNGRDYVVVALQTSGAGRSDVVIAEVASRGETVSTKTLEGNSTASGVAVSASGDGYVVVWTTETDVKAVAIPDDFSAPTPVRILASGQNFSAPRIVWTGSEHRVAFIDGGAGRIIKMMSVDSQANIIRGPVEASGAGESETPAFASLPHLVSVGVWAARGEGIIAGFFEAGRPLTAGIYSSTRHLTSSASTQGSVAAASTGPTAVAAWFETTSTGTALRARRTDGQATGGDIANVASIRQPGAPPRSDVKFDGSTIWISWLEDRTLFTRRYSADLVPRDSAPVRVADRVQHFDSAGGIGRVLFVWSGEPSIAAAVMTPNDSAALSVVFVAPEERFTAGDVAAVWNGTSFSLSWARLVRAASQGLFEDVYEIRSARVSAAGALLDSTTNQLSAPFNANFPTVWMSSSSRGVITAWQAREGSSISIRGDGPEVSIPATHPSMRIESLTSAGGAHVLGFSTAISPGRVQYWIRNIDSNGASSPELVAEGDVFGLSRSLAVAPLDQRMIAFYVRRADGAEFGGVNRLFMKIRTSEAPRRRRAVTQ